MNTKMKHTLTSFAPLLGFVLTTLLFAAVTGGKTLSIMNLRILLSQFLVTALVATGGVFSFSCGALDMSLGGSACLAAVAGALLGLKTNSVVVMIVATLVISMLIAYCKGVVAAYLKLPVFIVTIVFGSVLGAIALVLLKKTTTLSVSSLVTIKDATWLNIGMVAVFYLFCLYIFNFTKIGKSCKLQGGNLLTATELGIDAKKNIIVAFLMSGLGVALAAVAILIRTKTASASTASSVGTDMMVAIVLGGMPLSGGPRSRISAGLIGAAIFTVLKNGLQIAGLSIASVQIVRGIVFLAVVYITSLSYRTKLLPR